MQADTRAISSAPRALSAATVLLLSRSESQGGEEATEPKQVNNPHLEPPLHECPTVSDPTTDPPAS